MVGKISRFAAVAAAATALVAIAGNPASAAGTAYNTRTLTLNGNPSPSDATACVSKSITLAAGNYTWSQVFDSFRVPTRDISLAAGSYTWKDCLVPGDGGYTQTSYLAKSGSPAATLVSGVGTTTGSHTFGSLLDPKF
ncbi:hypothetical protein ACGFNV_28715 [Streptomyces sp. NPDC048751]|uniref:hypothetical protein n=1 Tax=Streptomyces sp. NPDC048751 TaxID=3365591 RepID=UPI0037145B40